ncbi:MAG: tRNA (N(6)-L-threonylcarbamoyladenosine(37)-C(2))-methylthiotransferase MtaB [Oscillospiraceae bacterium]|nr:tRNA (N(6)-L-threonylcarbamoyladenosine(37)-C(2))-methylthiotransferase MtaB [Oscillospiraceae bacterium]
MENSKNLKFFLQNFGCKVNATETESIAVLLQQDGWKITNQPELADAVVLNSCTVTASGDQRMLQAIRKLRAKAPQNAVFLLTGCYVQAFPEDAANIPGIDLILGTKNRMQIPVMLRDFLDTGKFINAYANFTPRELFESLPQGSDPAHTRAFLKIQDGCNRFCSYCIIPYARGRCRSLGLPEIAEKAEQLKHYPEVVLCGINLACYGMGTELTITDAVKCLADAGIPRIRLGSLEPDGLTDAVLAGLQAIPGFLPHFHISVQSGCDRILKAMHRNYTCAEYERLILKIRALFPDCAITTDLMTGFPGETEQDFCETLEFVKKIRFSQIHIFRYSPRPGTVASEMPGQIPEQIKKIRAERLHQLAGQLHEAYLKSCVNKVFYILFERQKHPDYHTGHAENYMLVEIPANPEENLRGQIHPVKITGIRDGKLTGILN